MKELKNSENSSFMKFIRILLLIIMSIALTVILTGGIFAYTIQSFVSIENTKIEVSEIGVETLIDNLKTIIRPNTKESLGVLENYLDIPEVQELLSRLIDQSVDYIMGNGDVPFVTDADIDKIVNSDYYEEVLGISLSEEVKIKYSAYLKESYAAANETIENQLSRIKNTLFENNNLKTVMSNSFMSVTVILLIILVVLIGVCRWSLYHPLSWIGTSAAVAGGVSLILSFIINAKFNHILPETLTSSLLAKGLDDGLIVLGFGVALLVVYFIINAIVQRFAPEDELTPSLTAFPEKYDADHISADIRRIKAAVPDVEGSKDQPE